MNCVFLQSLIRTLLDKNQLQGSLERALDRDNFLAPTQRWEKCVLQESYEYLSGGSTAKS